MPQHRRSGRGSKPGKCCCGKPKFFVAALLLVALLIAFSAAGLAFSFASHTVPRDALLETPLTEEHPAANRATEQGHSLQSPRLLAVPSAPSSAANSTPLRSNVGHATSLPARATAKDLAKLFASKVATPAMNGTNVGTRSASCSNVAWPQTPRPPACKSKPLSESTLDAKKVQQAKACICGTGKEAESRRASNVAWAGVGLPALYSMLCCWGFDEPSHPSIMKMETSRREALIEALAPSVETAPAVEVRSHTRAVPLEVDCHHKDFSSGLFSGERRSQPVPMIDVISGMGGGAELDLLEMRLYELSDVVNLTVIPESSFNFRGDRKPRHFSRERDKRFKRFLPNILYLDLDTCDEYSHHVAKFRNKSKSKRTQAVWSIQTAQRNCIWRLLFAARPDLQGDTLIIFTDLDEIPRANAMFSLRHCELDRQGDQMGSTRRIIALRMVAMPFNMRVKSCSEEWKQGVVIDVNEAKKRKIVPLRPTDKKKWILKRAGIHMTYMGSLGQVNYKMIQHGEAGSLLAPLAGYEKQGSYCLAAVSEKRLDAMQRFLQDDPHFVVRHWEGKCSPLPREEPRAQKLEACLVPWILRENPSRYPAFMGFAGGKWTDQ
eukprot:TRINITY_DN33209_c0_g1_i1.p1 TRINITY_DN33209_c0_g1~~TRINITY_DN33209_c0_g1_i1.p1  ORF type:complete len:606 (+),score=80.93 TRINITY_DN33209_c0_g1_i1:53-1870(+)